MKKLMLALLAIFLLIPTVIFAGQNKNTICHLPPGNPSNGQTISIPVAQWERPGGHSLGGHGGDYTGECQNPTATPTPTTTISPTPTSVEPTPSIDPNASPTPTTTPEPTPTSVEPTPSIDPNASPTPTTTPEPTPTSVEPTVESEVQGAIDQIIALIEKLVDFIQNL